MWREPESVVQQGATCQAGAASVALLPGPAHPPGNPASPPVAMHILLGAGLQRPAWEGSAGRIPNPVCHSLRNRRTSGGRLLQAARYFAHPQPSQPFPLPQQAHLGSSRLSRLLPPPVHCLGLALLGCIWQRAREPRSGGTALSLTRAGEMPREEGELWLLE